MQRFVLTLSCPDRTGIVAAVANFLLEHQFNIVDSAQFGDEANKLFFMRVCFAPSSDAQVEVIRQLFAPIGAHFAMQWAIHDVAIKHRVMLLVSKFGHCLNDLLYRHRIGALPIEIPAIVSNHRDFYQLAAANNIPFHYLPFAQNDKAKQELSLIHI